MGMSKKFNLILQPILYTNLLRDLEPYGSFFLLNNNKGSHCAAFVWLYINTVLAI